jgi:hypothetical protein
MKTSALLKRLPTVLMVGLLSYACYTVHGSVSDLAPARSALTNGLDVMINDFVHAGKDEVKGLARVMLRDPFRAVAKAADASEAAHEASLDDSTAEALARIVQGLTLDATFLHGQARIAIISGRIYHQGQHLVLPGDSGKSYSPLFVQSVQAQRVTLAARGKSYALSYPDQLGNRPTSAKDRGANSADGTIAEVDPEGELAFYKRLLNSPLGKMGKSLTGNTNVGTPSNRGRAASRSARSGTARGLASGSSP